MQDSRHLSHSPHNSMFCILQKLCHILQVPKYKVLHYAWHNSGRVCLCLCGFVCFCRFWLIQTHYAQISCLDGWILLCLTGLDAVRVGSTATLPFSQQAFAHHCLCGRWKKPAINTDLSPALRFLAQCLVWSQDLSVTAGPRSVQRGNICSEILRVTHRKSLRYALQSNVCLLCSHFYMRKLLYENYQAWHNYLS